MKILVDSFAIDCLMTNNIEEVLDAANVFVLSCSRPEAKKGAKNLLSHLVSLELNYFCLTLASVWAWRG